MSLPNLLEREFNVETFATYPKCTRKWHDKDTGAGCLWTAFMAGFGFQYTQLYEPTLGLATGFFIDPTSGETVPIASLHSIIDPLLMRAGMPVSYPWDGPKGLKPLFSGRDGNINFVYWTIGLYDSGNFTEALEQLWNLIESLPRTTSANLNLVREDVLLPTCA